MSPVHDYVIDNSTGANVRSDINNVLQAILTNNSSSSAPSTTAAYMWWADTTNGVLKIRNSSNNDWVELLQLDGTLTLEDGSASTPALANRSDLNTGVFFSAADTFNVATGGVERMELGATTIFNEDGADVDFRIEGDTDANLFYVDAGNDRVGIGLNNPSDAFHVFHATENLVGRFESGDTGAGITLKDNTHVTSLLTTNGAFEINVDQGGDITGESIAFKMSGSEKMRIDSSGRLLIGHSSARTGVAGMGDPLIQHEGLNSDDSAVSLIRNTNSAFGGSLILGKTRGTSVGANTLVQNGDDIFTIRFAAGDGTDINSEVATIKAEIDGVASANDVPGRLAFATTADGASAPTERMRIDSSGRLLVGTSSGTGHAVSDTNNPLFQVESSSSNDYGRGSFIYNGADSVGAGIYFAKSRGTSIGSNTVVQDGDQVGGFFFQAADGTDKASRVASIVVNVDGTPGSNDTPGRIVFSTTGDGASATTEHMRITQAGDIRIGTSNATTFGEKIHMRTGQDKVLLTINSASTGTSAAVVLRHARGGLAGFTGKAISFVGNDSTEEGSIVIGTTATSYITSSDYRLKENEVAISDGITRLKQLKPYQFNFKKDPSVKVDGFFAHEVSSIVPIAVTGEKDAVKEDGSIEPQGIDQSKLVPLLVAAVKELITKVETLEAA